MYDDGFPEKGIVVTEKDGVKEGKKVCFLKLSSKGDISENPFGGKTSRLGR